MENKDNLREKRLVVRKEVLDRFWAKVKKTDTCWLWTACIHPQGYGVWSYDKRMVKPHRFSYEIHKGIIPPGLVIDHLCRVRNCVNPEHLEAVTNKENILRGEGLSGKNSRKTHCNDGHEFTPSNTYVNSNGERRCRICSRIDITKTRKNYSEKRKDEIRTYKREAQRKKSLKVK
jgi:hypothetical protein